MTSTGSKRIAFQEPWTPARVMARLTEAANSLRVSEAAAGPTQRVTWWPDVVHDRKEAYGYSAVVGAPTRVSSDQIARMDLTLEWVTMYLSRPACAAAQLPADSGWLVWARAAGWSYAKIGRARKVAWGGGETRGGGPSLSIPGGNARPSLVKIERNALLHVSAMLNRTPQQVDRDARQAQPLEAAQAGPAARQAPSVRGIRTLAPERGPPQYQDLDDPDAPKQARTRSMAR